PGGGGAGRSRASALPEPASQRPRGDPRQVRQDPDPRDEPGAARDDPQGEVLEGRHAAQQGAGPAVQGERDLGGDPRGRLGGSAMTTAALTKKDFVTDQEVRWCPGCGDY